MTSKTRTPSTLRFLMLSFLGVLMLMGSSVTAHAKEAKVIGTDVTPTYEWTIDTGVLIKPITVTNKSVYLLDSNNNKVKDVEVKVERSRSQITITPTAPYKYGETYKIVLTERIKSVFINRPFKYVEYTFKTEADPTKSDFYVESIE